MSSNILLGGSVSMKDANTPTRAGQRVATENDLINVPTPFVGQIVYIEDQNSFIYVKSLKSKKVGNFEIKNALIDEYELLVKNNNLNLNWNEVL